MPGFDFSAKDTDGKTITGTLIAGSEKEVAGLLRERGLFPQKIMAQSEPKRQSMTLSDVLDRVFLGPPLATQMFVFQQLFTMLSAGMSLSEALNSLLSRGRVGRLRKPLVEAQRHVMSGGRLSDVLQRYPWLFSGLQLGMIEAGETGGGLDRAFGQIADYLEKDLQIRRKFSRATLYPKLLLAIAIMVPKLPLLVMEGFEPFARATAHTLIPLLGAVLVLWVAFRVALQIPVMAVVWDTAKLVLPGVGTMVRKFALAKFSRAMAVLYEAGVPIARCVELAAKSSGNESISSRLCKAVGPLRQGVDLHTALSRTGALTGVVKDMLGTGQMTGSVDAMMNKVAEYYEAEAESSMDKTAIVVGIGVFLIVAVFVGYTILGMYGNYGKTYTDIMKN